MRVPFQAMTNALAALWVFINLDDDEQTYPSAHLWGIAVHASHYIYNGLSNSDDHPKHWKSTEEITCS